MKNFLLLALISASFFCHGQQSELFRTIYYPAEPYGGTKELEHFVKQEMVYPAKAKEKGLEGSVFITFKVNSKGEVIYKEISAESDSLLQREAERIFDKIVWVKDHSRSDSDLGYEKLQIKFSLKKYARLVKRRTYDDLPDSPESLEVLPKLYSINQVDVKPKFTAARDMNLFLRENFKYPNIALQQNISGRVVLEFVVEPYGMASNIRVVDPVGGGCNEETVRLVRLMRWEPAKKDGKPVRCLYEYQLNFVNPGASVR